MTRYWIVLLSLMWGVFLQAAPAPPQPPLSLIWGPDFALAEGKLEQIDASGRLHFVDVRVVHGADPVDSISVSAEQALSRTLTLGDRFVFLWSDWVRSPSNRKEQVLNPNGPQLLVSPGLEPALFPATSEIRSLLLVPPTNKQLQSAAHKTKVIDGLRNKNKQLQVLFAYELFARKSVRQQLTRSNIQSLKQVVLDTKLSPLARSYVLAAARQYPQHLNKGWEDVAKELIHSEPVAAKIGADNEVLILAAFSLLPNSMHISSASLTRWLRSANGALVEQALLFIHQQMPEQELGFIDEALSNASLPEGSQLFLSDYRRRLLLGREQQHKQ
jgi:hypothetical protein